MRLRQLFFPGFLILYFLALWYLGEKAPYEAFAEGWPQQVAHTVFQISLYYIPAVIACLIFLRRRVTPFVNFFLGMMVVIFALQMLLATYFLVTDLFFWGQSAFYSLRGVDAPSWSNATFVNVKRLGLMLLSAPLAYFIYGITRGKYNYQVRRVQLTFPDLPATFDGFRFVQISDIHSGSFDDMAGVRKGIDLIAAQKPDLLVFTGDLVNGRAAEIEPYIPHFRDLSAPFGKYAVTGNHDYSSGGAGGDQQAWRTNVQAVQDNYGRCGFELLNNRAVSLKKEGETIQLIGVENWGKPPFPQFGDLDRALQAVPAGAFKILLSHDPSHWDEKVLPHAKQVHLTLSGHTHGMQFGLDFAAFKWSPVQYVYPRWAGLYEEARQYLYVNRGFGWLAFPGRIGVYPEITVFELKRAQ